METDYMKTLDRMQELAHQIVLMKASGQDRLDPDSYSKLLEELDELEYNDITDDRISKYWN